MWNMGAAGRAYEFDAEQNFNAVGVERSALREE